MQSEKDYEIVVKTLNSVYSIWNDFFFFVLFENGHFYNVVSTLTNVLKLDVEIENVVSTLSNINHTTLKYTTLIRRWFDVVLLRDVISTERNVETTLKFLLGKNCLRPALLIYLLGHPKTLESSSVKAFITGGSIIL